MENLLEILATPKQVGVLIGAGVSKACGLPNIEDLTKECRAIIVNDKFDKLLDKDETVEVILNKIQQLKALLKGGKTFNELTLTDVQTIETNIKKKIFDMLSKDVSYENLSKLVVWLNFINRDYEKEIFSLNYDLLIEKALEDVNLPYFTGFVGNVKPFFISDSVDDFNGLYVKQSWVKLWKLHGSLNFIKSDDDKIFIDNSATSKYENLLIYPSMDKYLSSRKAPFISYLDRFRKYLLGKEKVVLLLGYSFGDDHINDVIINGLNNNHRLSIITFAFDPCTFKKGIEVLGRYPNFSIYTDKKKYINGSRSEFNSNQNIGDFNNLISVIDSLSFQKATESTTKAIE